MHAKSSPTEAERGPESNRDVAAVLDRIAELLEAQQADRHRVGAYRRAARSVAAHPDPVVELARADGRSALESIEGVGRSIAGVIAELARTGRSNLRQRLEGEVPPRHLFEKLPGVGPELAERIHEQLGIDNLEDLEAAAHDGRLTRVAGLGPRKVRGLRDALEGILSQRRRGRRRQRRPEQPAQPPLALCLDVDAAYRRRAAADELKRIAPKRFNPQRKRWLPVMHTERGDWEFTALFSNTARAHQRDATDDWVVLYFQRDGREGQCTVVTESRGELAGKRVVRGRERESREHHRAEE